MKNNSLIRTAFNCFLVNSIIVTILLVCGTMHVYGNDIKTAQAQQQRSVSGTITDESGNPLPGVTVYIKGTTIGVVTDNTGNYSLRDVPQNATLVFSFIGMKKLEIQSGNEGIVDAVLLEDIVGLEEVVVVGYGVQKRVNLTGSVTAIKSEELTKVTVPLLAQGLMGKSPGLFIKNKGGEPGDLSSISYNIRGFGTPLIIIDGMPATSTVLNQLDPNDIESFSVLKDAAASAIYGARAGNGVILVTTKRGSSGLDITLSSNNSLQFFTAYPQFVNSYQMAAMENVANMNMGLPAKWTDEQLQKFKEGNDPEYPNTNWWDETLRKYAPQMQQNISIQGGKDGVKYFVSGNYFYQEALARSNDTRLNRYNVRSNIDVNLTKRLTLGLNLNASLRDYKSPASYMERNYDSVDPSVGYGVYIFRALAYWPASYPDPTKPVYRSPVAFSSADFTGYIQEKFATNDIKVALSYDLPLGFKTKAIFQYYQSNLRYKQVKRRNPYYNYDYATDTYTIGGYSASDNFVYEKYTEGNNLNSQFFLNWDRQIKDHNLSAVAVFEYLSNESDWFSAQRFDYAFKGIDYLFAGPDLNKTNDGSASFGGRIGFVSRVNYNYKGKYLLEANGRYDASALFPKKTRWGFFPSVSLGWRISEERFIKEALPFIDNLKIRASWGQLGYDNTSTYQWLETYSVSPAPYIFDSSSHNLNSGIYPDAIPNPLITWEKMTSKNVGIDFNLWNSKLEGSLDYFYRLRSDVLGTRSASLPNIVGASMPRVNYAKYDNRGIEFSLQHKNTIGSVYYTIGGNIAYNREKCVYIDQNEFATSEAYRTGNKVGEWTDRWWGRLSDGLFQSQEEIDNWAVQDQKGNSTIRPGDVKLVDYNQDGVVNSADDVVIGRGNFPKIMYGIEMNVSYMGIGISALWQGAGLFDINLRAASDLSVPFYYGNTPLLHMWDDSYTPENPWMPSNTTNAKWPIYGNTSWGTRPSYVFSDFWLIRGDYLRLKTLELSYTLNQNTLSRLRLKGFKIYLSGYNLLTFSELRFLDPEADDDVYTMGVYYPPTGTYNMGFVVNF